MEKVYEDGSELQDVTDTGLHLVHLTRLFAWIPET